MCDLEIKGKKELVFWVQDRGNIIISVPISIESQKFNGCVCPYGQYFHSKLCIFTDKEEYDIPLSFRTKGNIHLDDKPIARFRPLTHVRYICFALKLCDGLKNEYIIEPFEEQFEK